MDRVPTGIPGLDVVLRGGFAPGSLLVIGGGPGTGKTILAQQMCFANATPERKAVYYTTSSEPHSKMVRHLEPFSFFDPTAIARSIEFINVTAIVRGGSLAALASEVVRKCFDERPIVVVIDSSKALHELGGTETFREAVYDLSARVSHTEAVLVLVGEYSLADVATAPEFAVADGIIFLANESEGPIDNRWVRVMKLRGSDYLGGVHSSRIGPAGFEVFPRLESTVKAGDRHTGDRISTGVPTLDVMMGGGIPSGGSTLIAGPSGGGKTVLGLHFVGEAARRGERSLFISFQESEEMLRTKARTFGWDFATPPISDLVRIIHEQPVEMGLDQIGSRISTAFEEWGPHRVVIDSLTELERAARTTGRFPDFLWTLVGLFSKAGASSLLTMETSAFFGPSFELAHGLSFTTDNVILLRYAEMESEIRRALLVVKMRESDHVKSLVEFEITPRGVAVKGKFAGMSGVLTGTPTKTEERFREFFGK